MQAKTFFLDPQNKANIFSFLEKYTSYPQTYLSSLPDNQLYAMYKRTQNAKHQMICTILDLQSHASGTSSYTQTELGQLDIDSLTSIKNSFTNEKPQLIKMPTAEKNSSPSFQNGDFEYLDSDELIQMYGEDAICYSNEELYQRGVYSLSLEKKTEPIEEKELKKQLISFLLLAHQRRLIYFPFSRKELSSYSLNHLKTFYISRIKDLPEKEGIPTLDELVASLTLSKY